MTEGTAVSPDAGFCTGGGVVEISVEVIGVLAEVVVLVAATGAVLCVAAGSGPVELVVGPAEVAAPKSTLKQARLGTTRHLQAQCEEIQGSENKHKKILRYGTPNCA